MKPSKFLSTKLVDKLVQPLLDTFKLMFISMTMNLSERETIELLNDKEFINVFEICIRDSLSDYQNPKIEYKDLFNDIKYNIGLVYNYTEKWCEKLNERVIE